MIGKEANCEEINHWIRDCENHLSWSAKSTSSGDGNVIKAKFYSFLGHIVNKHSNLENPLFNQYAHGEIEERQWLDERMSIQQYLLRCFTISTYSTQTVPSFENVHLLLQCT